MLNELSKEEVKDMLLLLQADAAPAWGTMDAQEMLEHLEDTLRMSNGVSAINLAIAEEKVPAYRAYLLGPGRMRRGVKTGSKNTNLRYSTMQEAVDGVVKEIEAFESYFAAQPDATPVHPIFGPLTLAEWRVFHHKHFTHHLTQFGLLEDTES